MFGTASKAFFTSTQLQTHSSPQFGPFEVKKTPKILFSSKSKQTKKFCFFNTKNGLNSVEECVYQSIEYFSNPWSFEGKGFTSTPAEIQGQRAIALPAPTRVPTALYVYGKLGCLEENFSSQFFNRVSDDVNYFVATQYRLSRCAVWWRCSQQRRQRLVTALRRLGCTPLPHRRRRRLPRRCC